MDRASVDLPVPSSPSSSMMGIAGIISEHKGSVARDVMITEAEWDAMKELAAQEAAGRPPAQGELFPEGSPKSVATAPQSPGDDDDAPWDEQEASDGQDHDEQEYEEEYEDEEEDDAAEEDEDEEYEEDEDGDEDEGEDDEADEGEDDDEELDEDEEDWDEDEESWDEDESEDEETDEEDEEPEEDEKPKRR